MNIVLLSQDDFDSLVFCDLIKQNRPRRDGKSTQKNYTNKQTNKQQQQLNDPDNHSGVFSHSEPDLLECEVTWVLRSTAAHKASGGDRMPAKLLKILKDDASKVFHSNVRKFGKTSRDQRTGRGPSSSLFPRRAVLKNVQATEQLYSSAMLVRLCSIPPG